MTHFLQQVVYGLQLGSIYALIALGYTMVYGVLRLINFAHGDVFMVGAYISLFTVRAFLNHAHRGPSGLVFGTALLLSIVGCGLLGVLIERFAYRPLRKAPRLASLITAIGVSLLLESIGVLPQVFGSAPQTCPDVLSGQHHIYTSKGIWAKCLYFVRGEAVKTAQQPSIDSFPGQHHIYTSHGIWIKYAYLLHGHLRFGFVNLFNGIQVERGYLIMFGATLCLLAVLWYIVTKTKLGRAMRAVSFDTDAASLMGVNTNLVIAFTFFLGSALAGAAGFLFASLTKNSFTPYIGVMSGVKAFVAAVVGGIGNIPGAAAGGFIMGLAESLVIAYGQDIHIPSTYSDAVAFAILIVILLLRPSGLFGKGIVEKV